MTKSGIYKITCTANGKIYIGSTFKLSRRWADHQTDLARGKHGSKLLQAAWNEHGAAAFVFEVIELVEDLESLVIRERHYFELLRPIGERGFNVRWPGIRGPNRSLKKSPEQIAKMRTAVLGRRHSEETKQKLRRAKLSDNPMKGTRWADTHKERPARHKAEAHHYFGKKRDESTKRAISEKNAVPVIQKTREGDIVSIWPSAYQAAQALGLKRACVIYKAINGKVETARGYKWEYVDPGSVKRPPWMTKTELSGRG